MQKYELVLLLDAAIQEKERQNTISQLESDIKDGILQKDEMGLKKTMYDFQSKKGKDHFYFYSYQFQGKNDDLELIKKQLLYNKIVARYAIYKMNATDTFWTFEAINKELEKILEALDEKKTGPKVTFFKNKENRKYITWKALPILKKYVTRFGSIKPRKYTGNLINVQKKVKEAIQRARELGLVEYIK